MKKQNYFFPLLMLALSLVLAEKAAHAAGGPIDVMCRNKAKELAVQTYQTCVTEERASRLTDLKSRYKARMSEVKDEFQRELNEINGKTPQATATEPAKAPTAVKPAAKAKPVRAGRAEKPVTGVAKSLPAKQNDNGPALSMDAEPEVQTVVAAPSDDTSAAEPEIVEIQE